MKKNKPIKPLLIKVGFLIAVLIICIFSSVLFLKILKTTDYFKVKDIVISGQDKEVFSYLLGKSIFDIDLEGESSYILRLYPGYKKVRIIKIFPNRLFITFTKRVPVAYVKLYRDFCVDNEFVLFDPYQQEVNDLPVIAGLETKIFGVKTGTKYNLKELTYALALIDEAQRSKALADYKIKRVDVKNIQDTCCFFSFITRKAFTYAQRNIPAQFGVLEVKIGYENAEKRLRVLGGLINRFSKELNNIRYIDLRFKEPVIKFKDAAK